MKALLLIVIYFFSLTGRSQEWIKTYAPNYLANCIIETYDKGYIILGTRINGKYGCLIKTDLNGNVLWNKKIGNGQYLMFVNNIEQTYDNGFVISGTTTKYGNQQDAYILKLNSCGELEWCSDVYTPNISDDMGWRVKPTTDHGYVLLGYYNDPNPNLRTNLFKFDSEGSLQWHQSYLPDSLAFGDDPSDVLADSSGYLITAFCYYPDPGQGGGWERFYLIRTDTAGNKLWSIIYGSENYYHGYPLTSIKNQGGDYYSFGVHDILNSSKAVPAMIKVLKDGASSYNKDIVSDINAGGIGTTNWLNDSILILGGGWGILNSFQNSMLKIDTLGNLLKIEYLPATSHGILSTAKTFDDKFLSIATNCENVNCEIYAFKVNSDLEYDTLYTHPYVYDSLCPHPVVSDTINPDCNLVVNVEEPFIKPESHQMKVFPNPVKEKLTVVFPKYLLIDNPSGPIQSTTVYHQWKSTHLEVYDLSGKKVMEKEVKQSEKEILLDISGWQRGMYVFRLLYGKQEVGNQKVVVTE